MQQVTQSSVLPSIGAPYPFSADLPSKWDWGGAKTFDVGASPTQNMPFPYAFNFGWGEHCKVYYYYRAT